MVALEVRGTGMGVNREQISGGDSYRVCAQRVGRVRDARLVVGYGAAWWGGRVDDAGGPRRLETPVSLWSTRSRAVNLLSHQTPLAAAMGDKVCDCLDAQPSLRVSVPARIFAL